MSKYLRNCWYVACESAEIDDKPLGRTILDQPVALFRQSDGLAAAVQDRCPHRFVPLSMGKVNGNTIACGYHGLQFDLSGRCVHNPHGGTFSQFRITSYPVAERYGYVWIWTGDEDRADVALLPDFPFLEDPDRFRSVNGYLKVDAHHELISDNLLDLSHVEFLHPLLARPAGVAAHRQEFYREGDRIVSNRWKDNSEPNKFLRMFEDSDERRDARANMTWIPPSALSFDLGACAVGGKPEDGICTPAAHLLTPETSHTTHYFWSQARNVRLHDAELDEVLQSQTARVFQTEDRPMIEAQQREMGAETDIFALRPLLFKPDAPAVLARRVLAQLIAAEQASHKTPKVAEAASAPLEQEDVA